MIKAQIFEAFAELYKSRTADEEARRVRGRVRLTWRWKVHCFGFGCRGAAANVHLEAKLAKVSKDVVGARDEVVTRIEEERAVVRKEGGPELKGRGVPPAGRVFAHGDAAFAGHELGPRHAAGPL